MSRLLRDRHFRFNWKMTLFSLFFGVSFVALGVWQVSRGEEKRALLEEEAGIAALPPVPVGDWVRNEQPRRVSLVGSFDPEDFLLLDNRVLGGTVGFEVIQRFHDRPSDMDFYINRGFVSMGPTRQHLPFVPVPGGEVEITASVYRPSRDTGRLNDARDPGGRIIQVLSDLPRDDRVYPVTLRLAEGALGALPRHWPMTNMMPARHQGYALQWFTMAFAIGLAWLFFSFPVQRNADNREQPR